MIAYMQEDSERSLADALRAYQGYLEFRQAQRRAEEQRRLEEMRQRRLEREEAGYGQSESFIGGMLKTAGGVALGNKISGNTQRKDGKRDLYGTAVCQRCHTPKGSSWPRYMCAGCPAESRCTKKY